MPFGIRQTLMSEGSGLPGLLNMATKQQASAPVAQPAPVVQQAAASALPAAISTSSLADLLDPNKLGMGQQLSPEAWAAIDKATGTNIGPAQDGSPYYSFTGLTDENSTGWTPTQAYYDALNGYTASNLGNDANSNYWNIAGPNGTTSTAPTFASSAQESLGGLDKLVLAGIGAAAGPALFAGLGGGATAGLGANLLAGAGSGAVLGGTMGAVTSTGDMNAIGQGILNGGLTGALGGAVYQGLNGGSATIPADSVPNLSGGTGLKPLDVNSYAIPDIGAVPSVSSPVLSASSIPSLGSYGLGALEGMGPAVVPSVGSVPSLYSPASLSALSVPDLSQGTGLQPLQMGVVEPVNVPSVGLPEASISTAAVPNVSNTSSVPSVPGPQSDYSNEGSHYTDKSSLNPATDSPVNVAPAASPGLLDWLKANPELAKLGLTAAGGLLGGLGNSGGGSIAGTGKTITPNIWNVGKPQENNYTPPTQYAAPQLNMTGQQNSGAWRWMKG